MLVPAAESQSLFGFALQASQSVAAGLVEGIEQSGEKGVVQINQ
jgi:hypothetical protein